MVNIISSGAHGDSMSWNLYIVVIDSIYNY